MTVNSCKTFIMTLPEPRQVPGETDHWQALYLFDKVGAELAKLNDEKVLTLFRAANTAIAQAMIDEAPAGIKFMDDYLARADYFGDELQRRYHLRNRK